MQTPRYSTSRQKACHQCSSAKTRCERRSGHGSCTRCTGRGLPCSWLPKRSHDSRHLHRNDTTNITIETAQPSSPFSVSESSTRSPGRVLVNPDTNTNTDPRALRLDTQLGQDTTPSSLTLPVPVLAAEYDYSTHNHAVLLADRFTFHESEVLGDNDDNTLNFSNLNLLCPINANDIKNRWIQAYIPVPGQMVKTYPAGVSTFIYRTLKAYTATANIKSNRDRGCDSLSLSLLATFQSYLLYTMTLFFHLDLHQHSTINNENNNAQSLRVSITNLQDLACACARQGLLCTAESAAIRTRPRWEEWIVAETTRRTLYVMYLFDSILSTQEGLPTFLGVELRGLPAPAPGFLWRARRRREWEAEYNLFLVEWGDGALRIEELWPETRELDEKGREWRKERVERWVEGLDEYGTMLYAIMQCTHGG
ncbi:Zn(II)2Cys6 transcription factor domain-containing protein [Aspergillus foveolatus]|uniref:Zn(II)2Cys6 transcription factor domain-containing protein n=1 Tax=Aspergillus foveolatus TaxID=210207 RepID=UPI003CCC8FFC